MWTRHTHRDLLEERLHDLLELRRFNHVEDLLHLTQEHHLKVKVCFYIVQYPVSPKQFLFGELTTRTRTVGRPLLRWKVSLKYTLNSQTSPQRNGKTPQLLVAYGSDQFMTDSCYVITLGERGMPPSEFVVMQLVMRHHPHHKTPTCVDTAGDHAVVASAS